MPAMKALVNLCISADLPEPLLHENGIRPNKKISEFQETGKKI